MYIDGNDSSNNYATTTAPKIANLTIKGFQGIVQSKDFLHNFSKLASTEHMTIVK